MVQEAQQVESINDKLKGDIKLAIVSVADLEFLDKNARFMKNETFQNLVNNIKRDGALSSFPFCYLQPNGKYKILSGNHRSKAAVEAGLKEIPVIYTDKEMTKDEQLAVQLSHNSITGEDDPIILKDLYNEIEDLDLKYYAGLDDKLLEQLDKVEISGIGEAQLDYQMLSFLFLPNEMEDMKVTIDRALEAVNNDAMLARYSEYDRLLDAQAKTQNAYSIHNAATSLMVIMDIFERHQEDLKEGWLDGDEPTHKGNVPLSSILGTDLIPSHSAAIVNRAVEKMLNKGDVNTKNKWQVLEYLAAEYLSGD